MAYERKDRVEFLLRRYEALKQNKQVWLNHYQLIGQYVMTRKQNFTQKLQPGDFLTNDIFDTTGVRANITMAAILLGML